MTDDSEIAGWAEMTVKVASAYRPTESSTMVRVTTPEGYIVKLNSVGEVSTITMGSDVWNLDAGELSADARRRLDLAASGEKVARVEPRLLSRAKYVKRYEAAPKSDRRQLSFAGALMTSGSFTMMAASGGV